MEAEQSARDKLLAAAREYLKLFQHKPHTITASNEELTVHIVRRQP